MLRFRHHCLIIRRRSRKDGGKEVGKNKEVDMEEEYNDKECGAAKEDKDKNDIFIPWGGSTMMTKMRTTEKDIVPQ